MKHNLVKILLLILLIPLEVHSGDIITAPMSALRPTQEFIGHAVVRKVMVDNFKNWYKNFRGQVPYTEFVENKFNERAVPAVIGPNGEYFILDGHHRTLQTVLTLVEAGGGAFEKATAKLEIMGDYRGWDPNAFGKELLDKKRVYLSDSTRAAVGKNYGKIIDLLPGSFKTVPNDPLRSLVGSAFYNMGVDADKMTDYIQFEVAKKLKQNPLFKTIPNTDDLDTLTLKRTENLILSDPKVVNMLRASARNPTDQMAVNLMLEKALRKYELESPPSAKALFRKNSNPNTRRLLELLEPVCVL